MKHSYAEVVELSVESSQACIEQPAHENGVTFEHFVKSNSLDNSEQGKEP